MTNTTLISAPPQIRTGLRASRVAGQMLTRYGILLVLGGLILAAQLSYSDFLTAANLQNLITQNSSTAIVAVGMTFVIIAGGFDLSVSGIFGLGSVLFAGLTVTGTSAPLAFGAALLAGIGCGLLNGLVVTRLKVNAFVATLGTASAFLGIAAFYSSSRPISVFAVPEFSKVGTSEFLGLSLTIWIIVALFVVGSLILRFTTFGRRVYAVGGNREAARLAGLRTGAVQTYTFVISGLLAALAGCLLASKISTGQYDQGDTVALDAIAAVVIGGNSLYGGDGALWRTAAGVMLLATMNNLFSSLSIDPSIQNVIKGAVIIVAVAFEEVVRRRQL